MKVHDIVSVETEHGLGETTGPFVVLRVQTDAVVALGQLAPEAAREIAAHLMESAARAEYESDLYGELTRVGMPNEGIGLVMHAVRSGEIRRHTETGGS